MTLKPDTVSAVIDSLTALRDELVSGQGAPAPLPAPAVGDESPQVQDTAVVRWLDSLPVGAEIRDNDSDIWVKYEDGYTIGTGSHRSTAADVSEYVPLEIIDLPAPEPVYTAGGTKVPAIGDRVRVIKGFHTGSSIIDGMVGVVTDIKPSYNGSGRTCYIVTPDDGTLWGGSGGRTAGEVEVIPAEPEPEVEPPLAEKALDFIAVTGERRIQARPMWDDRLVLHITRAAHVADGDEGVFAYLSREDAARLAATLTRFAQES